MQQVRHTQAVPFILFNLIIYLCSCRIKRIEQKDELEQEKVGELSETEKLAEDNGKVREEIEALHRKYEALQKFALLKKIPLPAEMDPGMH